MTGVQRQNLLASFIIVLDPEGSQEQAISRWAAIQTIPGKNSGQKLCPRTVLVWGTPSNVLLPRVLGIKAVGIVDQDPSRGLRPGQTVATAMGGMGRQFDGGYAEYTCVPAAQVMPIKTSLDSMQAN